MDSNERMFITHRFFLKGLFTAVEHACTDPGICEDLVRLILSDRGWTPGTIDFWIKHYKESVVALAAAEEAPPTPPPGLH